MSSRGRPTTSLTHEQMSTLGLTGKEQVAQAISAPPPVFAPLMSKPVPLESNAARDYKILWKEDFISFLKDSPYFTHPAVVAEPKVQRYSDKYVNALSKKTNECAGDFVWHRLPAELRPSWKRKAAESSSNGCKRPAKQPRRRLVGDTASVEEKLKALEEKEEANDGAVHDGAAATGVGGEEAKARGGARKTVAGSDDDSDEERAADDEQDDEMDDENDYGNSYFDNGDAYNEEDDNLDDGPVY